MKVWRQGDVGRADFRTRRRDSPEKDAQTAVRRLLRLRGIPFWDTSQPRRAMVTAGLPDLLVFLPRSGLAFVEMKAPGVHKLSDGQAAFLACCLEADVRYYVVHSAAEMEALL